MGLFSRRRDTPTPDPDSAIADFWAWWAAEGRAATDAALASGDAQSLVEPVSSRVHAISDELAWEFGSGAPLGSEHQLTVTAEGVEREDVLACLREEGCGQGQGYLFGKAMPAMEIGGETRPEKVANVA